MDGKAWADRDVRFPRGRKRRYRRERRDKTRLLRAHRGQRIALQLRTRTAAQLRGVRAITRRRRANQAAAFSELLALRGTPNTFARGKSAQKTASVPASVVYALPMLRRVKKTLARAFLAGQLLWEARIAKLLYWFWLREKRVWTRSGGRRAFARWRPRQKQYRRFAKRCLRALLRPVRLRNRHSAFYAVAKHRIRKALRKLKRRGFLCAYTRLFRAAISRFYSTLATLRAARQAAFIVSNKVAIKQDAASSEATSRAIAVRSRQLITIRPQQSRRVGLRQLVRARRVYARRSVSQRDNGRYFVGALKRRRRLAVARGRRFKRFGARYRRFGARLDVQDLRAQRPPLASRLYRARNTKPRRVAASLKHLRTRPSQLRKKGYCAETLLR